MTIRLISTPGAESELRDRPPFGDSKGDFFRETSILRNAVPQFGRPKGARVGTDDFTLTFLSRTRRRLTGVTELPDPVVAGTGAFKGARGMLHLRALSGNRTLNVYQLTLP